MASLNGFIGNLTGTTGATGSLAPASGWTVYVLERGAHAAAASSGSNILFDSAAAASRFAANDWIQIGTAVANIRQVSAVAGTSITVSSSVTVAESDRILNCGTVQPVVASGLATYTPTTTIYPRDDDSATAVTASKLTTDSTGLYQFWASDNLFDLLAQDSGGANQFLLADVAVGLGAGGNLVPATTGVYDLGSSSLFWDDIFYDGSIISGHTSVTGSTVFNFLDTTGVTAGNLFAFQLANNVLLYGDTYGGIQNSWTQPVVYNVKSSRFGAKGDNSTDDTTAIRNAILAAAATENGGVGGIVYFPKGIYIVNGTLNVTTKVILRGVGRSASVLKAGGSFSFNGTTDAVVRLGDGSSLVHGARIENLTIDCNSVSGSIAVYSTEVNELSGVYHCSISNPLIYGIFISTSSAANFGVRDVEIFMSDSASSATAKGIFLSSVTGSNSIERVTINNTSGSGTNILVGIHLSHTSGNPQYVANCHFERCTSGIRISAGDANIINCSGHSSTTSLLVIDSSTGNVSVTELCAAGSAVGISDSTRGVSHVSDVPWYKSANANFNMVISGVSKFTWRVPNSAWFGTTLIVDGQLGVTGLATFIGGLTVSTAAAVFNSALSLSGGVATTLVQAGTTLTLPTTNQGNIFGLSSTATAILGITPLTHGRIVYLIGEKGSQTFTSGPSLEMDATNTLTSQDRMTLLCYGNTWYQQNPKGA